MFAGIGGGEIAASESFLAGVGDDSFSVGAREIDVAALEDLSIRALVAGAGDINGSGGGAGAFAVGLGSFLEGVGDDVSIMALIVGAGDFGCGAGAGAGDIGVGVDFATRGSDLLARLGRGKAFRSPVREMMGGSNGLTSGVDGRRGAAKQHYGDVLQTITSNM